MEVSWGASMSEVAGVAALTAAVYISVFVAVRLAGRRTVSQMSAFDVVVTIAIGSLIATTVLSSDVSYLVGITAIVTLLSVQQLVAVIRQRLPAASKFFDFAPERLYEGDRLHLRQSPLAAQLTEAELKSKLRQQGIGSYKEVHLAILEPDGRLSVWPATTEGERSPSMWDRAYDEGSS